MKKFISLFTTLSIVFAMIGTFTVFSNDTDITEISTLAELEAFRDEVNNGNTYEGKTVKLTADIDMSEKYGEGKESWTPISNSYDKVFSGTFDGNNHTINNLYINIPEYAGVDDYGLFGFIDGTLKNLNVNGSVICYSDRVAGIVASVGGNGAVIDCSFDGAVKGHTFVGGIATLVQGLISDCHCCGTVDGEHMVGGIVCNVSNASDLENKGIVENCTNESTVTAGSMAGGIVGALNIYAKVTGCVNKGEVKGVASEYNDAEIIGGIAGTNEISIVENCYNTGLVLGNQKIGGITGIASGPYSDYYTNKLAVKNCYNIGNITATGIEPTDTVGGVVGEIGEGATNNDITNCYYLDTCISGEQTVSTALTKEQFADKTNFKNWDFDTVWEMDETLGRPVLRSNREQIPVTPTASPTVSPTATPTASPTAIPTATPTTSPTATPTATPTVTPTATPTATPTHAPSADYSIKYENGKAIVTVPKDGTYTVIFASYDNSKLLSVSVQTIPLVKGENPPVSTQSFNANGKVRVMLWESISGMKPLCAAGGN